jgi:hypothetical protein
MQHLEQDLQIAIAAWLDGHLPESYWYTAIDHTYHGERRGATLRRMGVKRGQLDMVIYGPERFIGHLENKSAKGTTTPEQKVIIPMFRAFGHRVAICRTIEDAKAAIASWGIVALDEKRSTERIRAGFLSPQEFPESDLIGRRRRRVQ